MSRKTFLIKSVLGIMIFSLIISVLPVSASASYSFTKSDLERTFNAFLTNYYFNGGDFRTTLNDSEIHFWEAAFIRETMVDASSVTGQWKDKISETYYRYENSHSADRFGNPKSWIGNDTDWNDDYSWQIQFALAAYGATGDQHMLDQAKWHTDFFYRDYYDTTYGGGFWRERGVADQKDVPSNGFAISAAILAKYYPNVTVHNNPTNTDKTYLQIAQDTYTWLKSAFMGADGSIQNSKSVGRNWDNNLYTYNAGVFLELAAYLYDATKNVSYINDGKKVADFARDHFTVGSKKIIVYEDAVGESGLYRPDPNSNYEIVFKGILIRGVYKFIMLAGQTQYSDWLSNNAQAAYTNRGTNDLLSPVWDQPFGTNSRATGVATGLAAMTYSLLSGQSTKLSGKVEGEDGRKYGSAYNQADSNASGGYEVGSIDHTGAAVEFSNVAATNSMTIGYASALNGAKLSLYINGADTQDVTFSNTGKWTGAGAYTEKTINVTIPDGATVKFQYDSGDVAANIDYIVLSAAASATFYQDADYAGSAVSLPKGNYTLAQLNAAGIPNDWMTSLKVPSGWTVDVYQHDDFAGTIWTFTANNPNVGSAVNDQMSSVKIY
ncbi:glycoside hydrolase family 76 protein [Paenibacillus sp. SI8]|uniref:glycoside hydrolase family 76 protein n=1 Tax=unclassified Paenibacillus TaxID=185978 RepID=UPI003465A38B